MLELSLFFEFVHQILSIFHENTNLLPIIECQCHEQHTLGEIYE